MQPRELEYCAILILYPTQWYTNVAPRDASLCWKPLQARSLAFFVWALFLIVKAVEKVDMAGDTLDFNPYEILGVDKDSSDAQIVKAFRKAALKWHPDKNPDRKQFAQEMFLKISRALEILTDVAARAAYDHVCAAKSARKIYVQRRTQQESESRRKLREELERREASGYAAQQDELRAQAQLQKEIERLRKEGSEMLRRERENIEREIHRKRDAFMAAATSSSDAEYSEAEARLRLKWKRGLNDSDYDETELRRIFGKYGRISALVMSSSNKGSAIIEFCNAKDALKAENEIGDPKNPLRISWVSTRPDPESLNSSIGESNSQQASAQLNKPAVGVSYTSASQFADFEAEILAKMMNGARKKMEGTTSKFDDI
uniref:DnaJ homolog subfamily C member 17 n=1 Tax=Ascaris lumbricoides TaxID=6252 RepID=A0A0M3IF30_ASCLU